MIKTFRDLQIWQKSMELVTGVYTVSKLFPKEEVYCLTAQIRRCAVSVPSNIAEGYGRNAPNEFVRFLEIATGSLFELQTQIEIAFNLGYIEKNCFDGFYESSKELERMISSFIRSIHTKA